MSRARRWSFWAILGTGLMVLVWWLGFTPHDPGRVYAAIPASATFVSVHQGLAEDWPDLVRQPLLTNLLIRAGVKPSDLAKLSEDRDTRRLLHRLAGDETVLAYVPSLGYQDRPAWVFASWIGSESLILRLQLAFSHSVDFRPITVEHGRVVYLTRTPFTQAGQRLSLALLDGVLVGCVSTDPTGARWLLETADRYPWKPSLQISGQRTHAQDLLDAPLPRHWGWLTLPGSSESRYFPQGLVAYTLDLPPGQRMTAQFRIAGQPRDATPLNAARLAFPSRAVGACANMTVVLPLASVDALLPRAEASLWADAVHRLLATNDLPAGAMAVLAVLDAEHSSRIRGPLGPLLGPLMKGLRVPTLFLGLEVGTSDEADSRVAQALTQLNSRYDMELTARPVTSGGRTVTLIEQQGRGLYATFEPEERIAYAVGDGWMYLCSNAAILRRLMAAADADPGTTRTGPWEAAATSPDVAAAAWADFRAAAKTVRDVTGLAQLVAMASPSTNNAAFRQTLTEWRDGAEWLGALGEASATVRCADGRTSMNLVLGRDPSAADGPITPGRVERAGRAPAPETP